MHDGRAVDPRTHRSFHRRPRGGARRLALTALVLCLLAGPAAASATAAPGDAAIARRYMTEFYPLWFTHLQTGVAPHNQLIGPDRISPLYQAVVAINDDTLYASTPVDLTTEPVIVTVPPTEAGFSVLSLDPYGNILTAPIPTKPSGQMDPTTVYALVPPGYTGPLPAGATRVEMSLELTFLIFRVDRFSPDKVDQTAQATQFRQDLKLQGLKGYDADSQGGATNVLPEYYFALPVKSIADALVKFSPLRFLARLQVAVKSSNTPPLSPRQQRRSDAFDARFGTGGSGLNRAGRRAFRRGARTAHKRILRNYLRNRDRHQWIHFTNMGDWGNNALDRASITEFIQYGNGISTAAYYHTFRDRRGRKLRGNRRRGYVMRFRPRGQPAAERFWSLTAYTPQAVQLIPNRARKYLVARYTPGLQENRDGSVSIYIARKRPRGVPKANWLPVGRHPFNLMLRVYGVKAGSSVANNTYVPPAIRRR